MLNVKGRNKPCPCGSGKKYKSCCLGICELADTNIKLNERNIQKMLRKIMESKRLKKASVSWQHDEETQKTTYKLNNQKVLIMDYTGIPVNISTKENVEKVAAVVVEDIPFEVIT